VLYVPGLASENTVLDQTPAPGLSVCAGDCDREFKLDTSIIMLCYVGWYRCFSLHRPAARSHQCKLCMCTALFGESQIQVGYSRD
jgi:hypothetical protein